MRCRPRGGRGRPYRHLRHQAERAEDQLRLYPAGRGDRHDRCAQGGALRREAGRGDGQKICGARLLVELRQFPVPRRRAAGGAESLRAGDGGGNRSLRQGRHQRSRFPAARAASFCARAAEIDRLCGDGKNGARRGGDREFPLVGYRQLGCAVRDHPARCPRQCRAGRGRRHGRTQLHRAFRRQADGAGGRQGPGGGGDVGCGDGGAARARAGGQGTGGHAQGR